MLSLSSCPLFERVSELITGSKGSRAIGFLVMEPFKFEMDDDKKFTKPIGFDTETAGMEKNLKEGILEAAGGKPWTAFWYQKRDPLTEFYKHIFSGSAESTELKEYLRTYLSEVRKQENTKNCEVLIFSVIASNPKNPAFNFVYTVCYDMAENKMAELPRSIPRDQGSVVFMEEMGALIKDLCEKLYGEASP